MVWPTTPPDSTFYTLPKSVYDTSLHKIIIIKKLLLQPRHTELWETNLSNLLMDCDGFVHQKLRKTDGAGKTTILYLLKIGGVIPTKEAFSFTLDTISYENSKFGTSVTNKRICIHAQAFKSLLYLFVSGFAHVDLVYSTVMGSSCAATFAQSCTSAVLFGSVRTVVAIHFEGLEIGNPLELTVKAPKIMRGQCGNGMGTVSVGQPSHMPAEWPR